MSGRTARITAVNCGHYRAINCTAAPAVQHGGDAEHEAKANAFDLYEAVRIYFRLAPELKEG